MPKIQGSCRCGKVTLAADAEPLFTGLCHCRNCQKETGGAFSVVIGLPKPSLHISGVVTVFDSVGDSGKATHRSFCPVCGSTAAHWVDVMPDLIMINAGSLDDPSWVKPEMQIYCDSAQPWAIQPGMRQFPKMPS
jgi:hypothetical protein